MPGNANSGGRNTSGKSLRKHLQEGTYRADRHAESKMVEPTEGRPKVPAILDADERKVWRRLIWCFEDMEILSKIDGEAITAYSQLWVKTQRIREQDIEAHASLKILEANLGDVAKMDTADKISLFGNIVALHKVISKCTDQLRGNLMAIRQYLVEFGMTPASRSRIKLPKKAETADTFAAFQQQRKTG